MKRALVVTTIFEPTDALRAMASGHPDWPLVVVGDRKTPEGWHLDGAHFISMEDQRAGFGRLAEALPVDHYGRKNLGYLHAIREGAEVIAETDDDNVPYESFMEDVEHEVRGRPIAGKGWKNAYVHFTAAPIWPRGFPLDLITSSLCEPEVLGEPQTASCDIQQYLADGDPDVDAIYRLTTESETLFEQGTVLLEPGAVCPFNSQNTLWWPAAFPLLYMPSFVSFRMADTWRSFIAQVCLHVRDGWMAFHGPTVRHARHAHSLLADFEQEIPGYLGNQAILRLLSGLELDARMEATGENMQRCYAALVGDGFVPKGELELVELWLEELRAFTERS